MAALSPKGIINAKEPVFKLHEIEELQPRKGRIKLKVSHAKLTHEMDKTDVSSFGFGRSPERSTRSSNDHHSKLCACRIQLN
jgi:hypothetical protein